MRTRGLPSLALLGALSLACRRDAQPTRHGPDPAGSALLPPATLGAVCASACAGPFAQVTLWRNPSGAVARIELQGDLQRCSHPPTFFFDAEGHQTGAIPLVPVTPGSPEAQRFNAIRAEQTGGLTAAERFNCPRN